MIRAGRRPYLDFCFPQTPLTAYWNAATAAFLIAANTTVVQFATAGQPYGLCLVLIVAAFVCAVLAVDRNGPFLSAAAGLLAGGAAAGSLLTAPVAPVLVVWILLSNRTGSRVTKATCFVTGALISWLPIFWLFLQGPRRVFFNVIEYMLLYRRAEWPAATRHDFEVVISSMESPQGLTLGLLAMAGLFAATRAADRRWRTGLYLCFGLAAALAIHVSLAHPTFPQYYMFAVRSSASFPVPAYWR